MRSFREDMLCKHGSLKSMNHRNGVFAWADHDSS